MATVAVAAGLAISGAAHAYTNLLGNGSFETGDFTDWMLGGTYASDPADVIIYNSNAGYPTSAFNESIPPDSGGKSPDPAGSYAAYFVDDAANETLTQSIPLTPGLYTIGFSAFAPSNGYQNQNDADFSGSIAGVTLASYDVFSKPDLTWLHFVGVVDITQPGNYDAVFTFATPGGGTAADIVIDRAFVVAGDLVPEPATWATMIVGLGLAGAVMRRQRAVQPA
jgi:hypothetical protein